MAFFKKGGSKRPQYFNHNSRGTLFRRGRRSSLSASYQRQQRSAPAIAWWVIGASLGLLTLFVTAPYWLPVVASVIPDRYIMAYAPEPVQQLIFEIDVNEKLPTVQSVSDAQLEALLADPVLTMTPTPLPPAETSGEGGGVYIQPTPLPVAATPTMTPVFALSVDSRADDRENQANLNNADILLKGFTFIQQGYNNCGPASLTVLMSYWGVEFTQAEAANYLKPNPEDPNVRPDEMASYVERYNYHLLIRENGNIDLIKKFLQAGYPVLVETGYDPEPDTVGWTSHYLTIVGYSDLDQSLIAMDTYRRPNWYYPYRDIDKYWRQFNRHYLVAYRPDQAAAVASIVGEDMDDDVMYAKALKTIQFELSLDRNDPYAWFNLGSILTNLGRYDEAATAFDQARALGLPWRFLWYQFTPYEAYLQVGRHDDIIVLADSVLAKKQSEEAFYYKGLAYVQMGDIENARRQLLQAIRFNENYKAAQMALDALDQ